MQIKSFITGFVLCILISLSSLYSSMKLGILAWPTLFVSLISWAVLSRFKNSDMKQVTLAHTLASSGSMVAGAIAYTLPGFWIANTTNANELKSWQVILVSLVGVLLGTLCTYIYKKTLIDKENLDYPIGKATYLALNQSNDKKTDKKLLIIPATISGLFAILRDWCEWIPGIITLRGKNEEKAIPSLELWPSLMALSIGALLTPKIVLLLFSSAFGFQYIILPLIGKIQSLPASFTDVGFLQRNIAFGLILGCGCGVFLKSIFMRAMAIANRKSKFNLKNSSKTSSTVFRLSIFLVGIIMLFICQSKLSFISIILLVLSLLISTYLAARMTGESGINPMEVFAYISFIIITLVQKLNLTQSFLIMICVTVACGLAGDVMNDFKSGVGFKVSDKKQSVVEFIGASIGVIVAILVVFYLKNSKGIDFANTTEFALPQAKMMANFINDMILGNMNLLFGCSLLISIIMSIFGINSAIIGLGIFLPFYITLIISLGCLISIIVPKKYKENIPVIASGLLTGEGVVSMIISFFSFK